MHITRKYYPDFIIRLKNGVFLVLETKRQDDERNRTKREFLDLWIRAVNARRGFGKWSWAVSFDPNDVESIIRGKAKN